MADDVNANIRIDLDTSEAVAALRNLQAQISAFNQSVIKSNASAVAAQQGMLSTLTAQIGASRQFTTSMVNVETSVSKLGRAIDKNRLTLGEYFRYGAASSRTFGRLFATEHNAIMDLAADRVKRLQTQYIAMGEAQNGVTRAMAIRPVGLFNADMAVGIQRQQIFNKLLHDGSTSLVNWGKNTQWAGRQLMVGFTVPLTIFGGIAGQVFMDLERQIVNFRRVYGDATTPLEETNGMIEQIKELGSEFTKYGISVKDTITLASDAAAAGAQGADLLAQTEQATRLATLGMMEQQEALTATIALQSAFGLSAKELGESIDFLNAVENQTVVSLQDVAEAIPRVAPIIKGLGGDVQDLAIFLAAMREGGVNAAEGSNALKSGLASLINPTKNAREQLQKVGIDIDKILSTNKGDLRAIVMEFGAALSTLNNFQRQQTLANVFGKFQFARLGALFENVNRQGSQAQRVVDLTGESFQELNELAEKELGAISDSVGVKFTGAMERLRLAIAPIGEAFLKVATPIIEFTTKILEKFNELSPSAKNIAIVLATGLGLVVPTVTMLIGLFANFAGQAIKGIAIFANFFRRIRSGSQALNYLSNEQLDAMAASAALEGKVDTLTGSLNVQRAAVQNLTRAYTNYVASAGAAAASLPQGFRVPRRMATGGMVGGTGNKDSELALLTPGEFVMNRQATEKFGPALVAMNEGKLPGYQRGGGPGRMPRKQVNIPGSFQSAHFSIAQPMSVDELQAIAAQSSQSVRTAIQSAISAGKSVLGYTNEVVQVSSQLNAALNEGGAQIKNVKTDLIDNAAFAHQELILQMKKVGATQEEIDGAIRVITREIDTALGNMADDIILTEQEFANVVQNAYNQAVASGDRAVAEARAAMARTTTIGDPTGRSRGQRMGIPGMGSYRGKRSQYGQGMVAASAATGLELPYQLSGAFDIAPMARAMNVGLDDMANAWKQFDAQTQLHLASIRGNVDEFNAYFMQKARQMGINIGNALDGGARAGVGAASPAKDGVELVDDYVDGMKIGAQQNVAEARQSGAIINTAFTGGASPGVLPGVGAPFMMQGAGERSDIATRQTIPADLPDNANSAAQATDKAGNSAGMAANKFLALSMGATTAAGALSMMDNEMGDTAAKALPLLAIIDSLAIGMTLFGGKTGKTKEFLKGFGKPFTAIGAAITGLVSKIPFIGKFGAMFSKLGGVVSKVAAAFMKFSGLRAVVGVIARVAAFLGPQGIIAGIIALGVAVFEIYRRFETFRDAVSDLGASLVELFEMIFGPAEELGGKMSSVGKVIASVWNSVLKAIEPIFRIIVKSIEIVIKTITLLIFGFKQLVSWITTNIPKAAGGILDGLGPVGDFLRNLGKNIGDVFRSIPEAISSAWKSVVKTVVTAVNFIIDKINMLIDAANALGAGLTRISNINLGGPSGGAIAAAGRQRKRERREAEREAIRRGNEAAAARYQGMATAAAQEPEDVDFTAGLEEAGGAASEKEKTFFEQLAEETAANYRLFVENVKKSGKSAMDQLRAIRPPIPEQILATIGAGPEGLKNAQEFLNADAKERKALIERWKKATVGATLAGLTTRTVARGEETIARNRLQARGLEKDLVEEILQDEGARLTVLTGTKEQIDAMVAGYQMLKEEKDPIEEVVNRIEEAQKEIIEDIDKEIEKQQEVVDVIQNQIDVLEEKNQADQWIIRNKEREKELIDRQIESLDRANEIDQRRIDTLQRQDELRNRESEALNHELEQLSLIENQIRESYEQRIEALDKVAEINSFIVNQQKQQLGLSQALAEGDIFAATAAAQDMRQSQAEFAQQQMRAGLQQGMETAIAGLTTAGGLTREQAEQRIRQIKEQSYQTSLQIRDIEDQIFERNQQMIPLKDQQYQIDLQIRDIADRIFERETQINQIRTNQLEPAQQVLNKLTDQKNRAQEILDEMIDQAQAGEALASVTNDAASQADGLANSWHEVAKQIDAAMKLAKEQDLSLRAPVQGRRESNIDYASRVQRYEAERAAIRQRRDEAVKRALESGRSAINMYGGGRVSYKGSNEPPPAQMMGGGKVMKYGMGKRVVGYAAGNVVGAGSRDSVPAMLTPGEFVIRKAMVDKYGIPMLNALNQGAFGMPKYSINQPSIGGVSAKTQNNTNPVSPMYNNYSVNVSVTNTNASADEIANKTIMRIKQMQDMQIRSGRGY